MEARSDLESWLALTLERDPGMSETEWATQVDAAPPGVDRALAALLQAERAADALSAVDALGAYWHWKAAFADGAAWSRRVLDAASDGPPEQRARVLTSLAVMQFRCGDTEACRASSEEALALAKRVGDPVMTTSALSSLARS